MRKVINRIMSALVMALFCCAGSTAQTWNGVTGFATCNALGTSGVTGGGAGEVVHVSTRADLARYASSPQPYVIIIDKDITGGGMNDLQDELSINSDKTIIGAGGGKALNGVALIASGKHNIIIRNISLTRGRIDGVAFHGCHHVWIDHCDFSNSYDGLLDITNGSDFFTVSWVKLHDHNKVSITNSGTCHYDDYNKERVTFAHCMFKDNVQRNPRIGYGKMHIYNSYWENISSYCIGFHSQAQVLSENNHFSASANKPFCNQYTDKLPYCGYLTDKGSYFAKGDPGRSDNYPFTDITYTPLDYYDYSFDLDATEDVVKNTPTGIGPREGLQYEPILNPGNGAIDIPLSQRLSWGIVDGATSTRMYIGTSPDDLQQTQPEAVTMKPSTRYYWRVAAVVDGKDHWSPIYTFVTAAEKATKPYPVVDTMQPWLRYPSSGTQFCTDMPLSWATAADAAAYKVYLSTDEASLDNNLIGETTGLSIIPGSLTTGTKYFWRVDVVRSDGSIVRGDTWSFASPVKKWVAGKNETENMFLSGIAFREINSAASRRYLVVGDQGPGAICGVWGGEEGRYAIETAVFNQKLGPNYVGVAVNGKLIDAWLTTDENDNLGIRKTRNTVMLKPGDDIRIDFVAGLVDGNTNQSRSRIDYVNIIAAAGETVDVTRPEGIHHAPVSTPGYDCEYLLLRNVVFTDSLATVGAKGETQVKDKYCSWISKTAEGYTLYVKQTSIVKLVYRDEAGTETEVEINIDKAANNEVEAPATASGGTLYAIRLYKNQPVKTVYYKPVAAAGKDCELIWSPDVVFLDSKGVKGNAGKVQMRDGYDEWMKYHNPSANEVQAKNNVMAFIDPATDKESSGFKPKGADGSEYSYVVGTEKHMTYCLQGCSRVKFYYTGTGGAAKSVLLTVVNLDTGEEHVFEGEPAPGKNVVSNVTETTLDASCRYAVRISGTTGDMLIYAVKLWPGDGTETGIESVENGDGNAEGAYYNAAGQRVGQSARGLLIHNGQKTIGR